MTKKQKKNKKMLDRKIVLKAFKWWGFCFIIITFIFWANGIYYNNYNSLISRFHFKLVKKKKKRRRKKDRYKERRKKERKNHDNLPLTLKCHYCSLMATTTLPALSCVYRFNFNISRQCHSQNHFMFPGTSRLFCILVNFHPRYFLVLSSYQSEEQEVS